MLLAYQNLKEMLARSLNQYDADWIKGVSVAGA
jgi:hypothetical protein